MAKGIVYKAKVAVKGPRAVSMNGFGILNGAGDFWTPNLFETEADARAYWVRFWKQPGFEKVRAKWSDYSVIPVRARITARRVPVLANVEKRQG